VYFIFPRSEAVKSTCFSALWADEISSHLLVDKDILRAFPLVAEVHEDFICYTE
jgi:hypothetical protein